VLLFDRAFLAGSFREAWRRRYGLYLMLAGTWLLLGWLVTSTGNRGGPAGVGIGMSGWTYLCTQLGAIVHYLWLSVWPSPLVLDYGVATAHGAMEIVPYAVLLGPLAIATCVALWRWPKAGFFGAWFFAILAPTSSVLPVATQTMAEHRMYLPLAAVVMGVVVGGYLAGRWLVDHGSVSRRTAQIAGRCLAALVVAAFVLLTFRRNTDYASAVSIWQDTVDKVPNNVRARSYFGLALADGKRLEEAVEQYRKALKLDPKSAQIHNDLGVALSRNGRVDEAIVNYRIALEPWRRFAFPGSTCRGHGSI
jgi:tetratricopeptide (TPR) repeat protein